MTFQLDLSPEVEARLQHDEATRRGALTIAARAIEAFVSPQNPNVGVVPPLPKGKRRAAIQAGRGSMRGLLSSDELLALRHAEAQSELEKDRQTVWPQMQNEGSL